MIKYYNKEVDKISLYSNLILEKINSKFENYSDKTINLEFEILENHLFLFLETKASDFKIREKIKINIDLRDISFLYLKLYELMKENYVESKTKLINIFKNYNLSNINNFFLQIYVRDQKGTEINFLFNDFGYEREILEKIELDWINLLDEKKASKSR